MLRQMLRRVFQNNGFTILELVLSSAIIAIFMLGTGVVLSSAAKIYVQETASSGARGAIETAGDDIKNYIMSGKDARLLFYMDGVRTVINLEDGTPVSVTRTDLMLPGQPFEKGTILYTDGTYKDKDGNTGKLAFIESDPTMQSELAKVAEGIDLGYKMIYVTDDGKYIQGLPYSRDYYRGMEMSLLISEADIPQDAFYVDDSYAPGDGRYKGQNLYTIRLTGKGKNDIFTVIQDTAVMNMNDLSFN